MGQYTEKTTGTQTIHIRGEKSVSKQEVRVTRNDSGNTSWFFGGSGRTPHVTSHKDGTVWKTDGYGKAKKSDDGGSGK